MRARASDLEKAIFDFYVDEMAPEDLIARLRRHRSEVEAELRAQEARAEEAELEQTQLTLGYPV